MDGFGFNNESGVAFLGLALLISVHYQRRDAIYGIWMEMIGRLDQDTLTWLDCFHLFDMVFGMQPGRPKNGVCLVAVYDFYGVLV
tara:strand:- start:424 stop:678 length:255 start_codon:yes stop_codon:yes gene_type:complete